MSTHLSSPAHAAAVKICDAFNLGCRSVEYAERYILEAYERAECLAALVKKDDDETPKETTLADLHVTLGEILSAIREQSKENYENSDGIVSAIRGK